MVAIENKDDLYVIDLLEDFDEFYLNLEKYAEENRVPIIDKIGIRFLIQMLKVKNAKNLLSLAKGIIAGLSDKYVATAPVTLAPGIPHKGLISGANILLINAIAPNSDKRALIAPAITAIAIIKNTVFSNKSCAVAIIVLNIKAIPIFFPIKPNINKNIAKNTNVSKLIAFLVLVFSFFTLTFLLIIFLSVLSVSMVVSSLFF